MYYQLILINFINYMINSVSSFNKITPSENFIVKNASDLPIIRNKFTHYPENYAGEKSP